MADVFTYLIDFPCDIKEAVTKNEDDSYSIFINARLSHERQCQAYRHALTHVENGDFDKKNVQHIEHAAHKG